MAQLDFTDFMKEDVFGVPVDTSWGEAIGENLWFVALLVAVVVVAGRSSGGRHGPGADAGLADDGAGGRPTLPPVGRRARPASPCCRGRSGSRWPSSP